MLYIVYQNTTPDAYPVMIGVFLMKADANDFINSQARGSLTLEEVEGTWRYWNMIREELNEQVCVADGEY